MLNRYIVFFLILGLTACSDSEGKADKETPSGDPVCGNSILDPGETCDASELDGQTCESLGFGAGELTCRSNCQAFDRSACGAPETCGSSSVEGPETCDGTELAGTTCESLGYGPGKLGCTENCAEFDVTQCGPLATCGNGQIDDKELCDGSALGGAKCESLGSGSGTLGCADNCQQFDKTQCSAGCTPECGSRECGPDPECGSSCGTCEDGDMCTADGACVCVPLACGQVGAQCGTVADGCGGEIDCGGCAFPTECGADGMPNTCSCPLVSDGGTVAVDVPVVDITFGLTIGGQAITPSNTNSDDNGKLVLVDTSTQDRLFLPNAYNRYDGTTSVYPLTRRVVPGTYDIYYKNDDADSFWPLNKDALLQSGVDLTTSKTVNIDVPVVDVTFELTIGGQAITPSNTNSDDNGKLVLVDTSTQDRLFLPNAYNRYDGTTSVYPMTRRVVPGTYDIYYKNDDADSFWPLNKDALLQSGVDLTTSKTVNIDVPVVDVTFELTIGGQAITPSNTNSDDNGKLVLVDTSTQDRLFLPNAYNRYDGTTSVYPLTRRVVPGTYDIYYKNDDADSFWPLNKDALLQSGVDLTTSKTVNIDVPVVDVTFELTIGGQAITPSNTNSDDNGKLVLVDTSTQDWLFLPNAYNRYDGTTSVYPLTRRVVPGTYDIYYKNDDADSFWPLNKDALLQSGVDLTTSKTVNIDVPVVDVTFELTIGGQAITPSNTNSDDNGKLVLVDTSTQDRLFLPNAYNRYDGTTSVYPMTRRVVPGTYDIYYKNDDADSFWPLNKDALLQNGVDLTTSKTVNIDVPVVDVTFELTIGGQAITPSNTNSDDNGKLVLVDTSTQDWLFLPNAYNRYDGTTSVYPLTRRVVPGTYDVHYYNDGAESFWPVNDDAIMTCFTAQ